MLAYLIQQYELYKPQLEELDVELEAIVETLPGAQQMMKIPDLGVVTVGLFFTEVEDL